MTDHYAVFGNPIEHSKSPLIHSLFAKQTAQDIRYDKQCVSLDGFAAAAKTFFAEGGKGLNITVPFKIDAFQFADERTARAQRAGAVNTLAKQSDGAILGDNTDGCGIVRDIIQNLKWTVKGKRVLIVGAGGAVRGIIGPLLKEEPAALVIVNRTADKARDIALAFDSPVLSGMGLDQIPPQAFDLVINGTSASLGSELPALPASIVSVGTACYDMMYGREPTVFLRWAQQHGCTRLADGLGMLVEQAAESFFIWRGVRPDTQPVIEELRRQL